MTTYETFQDTCEKSGVLKEIREHPLYVDAPSSSIKHIFLDRNDYVDKIDRIIDEHNEYLPDIKANILAAVRSNSYIRSHIKIFDEESINELQRIKHAITDGTDENFVLCFTSRTDSVGLEWFCKPGCFVVDVYETIQSKQIKLEGLKLKTVYNFEIPLFMAYDIIDGLSVGNAVNEEHMTKARFSSAGEILSYYKGWKNYDTLEGCCDVIIRFNPSKTSEKYIQEKLDEINDDIMKELKDKNLIKCKVCERHFYLSADEKKWYDDKGFKYPHRCSSCRRSSRMKARDEQNLSYDDYYRFFGLG